VEIALVQQKSISGLFKAGCSYSAVFGKKLGRVGVVKVDIERTPSLIKIFVHAARPGLIIGRGGAGVEELNSLLKRI